MNSYLTRLVRPLQSRKVRVALATLLAAFLGDWGFDISEQRMLMIVGVGVAIILGIAHEDHGKKMALPPAATRPAEPPAGDNGKPNGHP